jgi:hypothetical protein
MAPALNTGGFDHRDIMVPLRCMSQCTVATSSLPTDPAGSGTATGYSEDDVHERSDRSLDLVPLLADKDELSGSISPLRQQKAVECSVDVHEAASVIRMSELDIDGQQGNTSAASEKFQSTMKDGMRNAQQ